MVDDPRDTIWNDNYELYYDTYYNELLAFKLGEKWSSIDRAIKSLILGTALISTIAGLALWNSQQGKYIWLMISIILVLLSAVNIVLNINKKNKNLTRIHKEFMALRYVLETFRTDIDTEPDCNVEEFRAQLVSYQNTYNVICQNNPNDELANDDLRNETQNELNIKLTGITQKGKKTPPKKATVSGIISGAPNPKPAPKSRQYKYNI